MTDAPTARRRRAPRPDRDIAFAVGNALFLVGLLVVGAASVWTIHRSGWFVLVAAVAIAAAVALALLGALRRMSWWVLALLTAAVYLLSVPLVAPSMITDPATIVAGIVGVATAPVTGWKNLLTLQLPLGSYQATLALPFLLLLALGALALSLALRARRAWVLAPPLALLVTVFGVVFGSSAVLGSWRVGFWELDGVWEAAVGLAAVLLAFSWYVWRAVHERRRALRAARRATGAHRTARATRTLGSRIALAAAMLVAALAAGALIAPWAIAGSPRDVLRTAVDPEVKVREALSPLADYRRAFSDEQFDSVLFTVDAASEVDRVRLATLAFYDGRVMRVTDPAAGDDDTTTAYQRVPSSLPSDGAQSTSARFTIDAYRGLWVPAVGALTSVSFDGTTRAALADGFFYNPEAAMGVELSDPGLDSGVVYTQTGTLTPARDPGTLTASGAGGAIDGDLVPESLLTWIEAQDAPTGGAGLVELIDRLRARGLLSHALTVPEDGAAAWMSDLGDYTFEPSRAGHSTDRIDALFTALNEKQADTGGTDDTLLVAAAGDDEQFAVAAALIADQLGFPARVVVGTRLVSDDADLAVCEQGECRGGDLAAWIEVQDTDGTWTAIDTTPQHAVALSPDVQQRRDPQNETSVQPERADTVLPPEADPADAAVPPAEEPENPVDLSWLFTALRLGGIALSALLILLVPVIAVLIAKAVRRRARRESADPVDRIVGGWEEYLDAAVDHGYRVPAAATRAETAAALGGEGRDGAALAVAADRTVFGPSTTTADDAERFWQLVEAERLRLRSTVGGWARWRARVSLRSFARGVSSHAARFRGGRSS